MLASARARLTCIQLQYPTGATPLCIMPSSLSRGESWQSFFTVDWRWRYMTVVGVFFFRLLRLRDGGRLMILRPYLSREQFYFGHPSFSVAKPLVTALTSSINILLLLLLEVSTAGLVLVIRCLWYKLELQNVR